MENRITQLNHTNFNIDEVNFLMNSLNGFDFSYMKNLNNDFTDDDKRKTVNLLKLKSGLLFSNFICGFKSKDSSYHIFINKYTDNKGNLVFLLEFDAEEFMHEDEDGYGYTYLEEMVFNIESVMMTCLKFRDKV